MTICSKSNNPIIINFNVHQNTSLLFSSLQTDESKYEYVIDVNLADTITSYVNWTTSSNLLSGFTLTVSPTALTLNNIGSIYFISMDNGTANISYDGGSTFTKVTIGQSNDVFSKACMSIGIASFMLVASASTQNIYLTRNSGNSWIHVTIPSGFTFPNNSRALCQMDRTGQYQLVTYYFLSSAVSNTSFISTQALISKDGGETWSIINRNYRQLVLANNGLYIYSLSYGASAVLSLTTNYGSSWTDIKTFDNPNIGFCPIFNVATNPIYITEMHIANNNTIINTSSDGGQTWNQNTSPYLINNAFNLEVSTISSSGKIQTYAIAETTRYICYSINYGQTWQYINVDTSITSPGITSYDLMDNAGQVVILQLNLNFLIFAQFSLTMNDLFSSRAYEQDQKDSESVELYLTPNGNNLIRLFGNNVKLYSLNQSILSKPNAYFSIPTKSESIGQKLLEVVATKIFGNPLSVAAIVNDNEFTDLDATNNTLGGRIMYGFTETINSQALSFFGQYVGFGKISGDQYSQPTGDATTPYNFNLTDTTIKIPLSLQGELSLPTSATQEQILSLSTFKSLLNGPDAGGSRMVNGAYNISFLLKFHYDL